MPTTLAGRVFRGTDDMGRAQVTFRILVEKVNRVVIEVDRVEDYLPSSPSFLHRRRHTPAELPYPFLRG